MNKKAGLPSLSLSMASASTKYLSISNANFGAYNHAKFAISMWFKRASTGSVQYLYSHAGVSRSFRLFITAADKLDFSTTVTGTSTDGHLVTTATYTDTNWHHLLVYYDSANGTGGDRMRMWVDGSEISAFDTDVNPTAAVQNTSEDLAVGSNTSGGATTWDGLLYQVAFFSGTLPNISLLYNSGHPVNIVGATGLWSSLDVDGAVTHDGVLSSSWTNNNTVTSSSTIPS